VDNQIQLSDWQDWQDWLNSEEMYADYRFTLLATELEPERVLQDSLTPITQGVWADEEDWWSRADFLLYLPLDLPLSDKQARCEAAKERMTLMLRLKSSLPPQPESSKAVEEMPVWAEAARRLLPSPSPAPAIDSDTDAPR